MKISYENISQSLLVIYYWLLVIENIPILYNHFPFFKKLGKI